ncbi:MAG: DUF4293 family protein [Flavobacteriales bacterium]|jgi:hypothetical protein|nr:DUF4293 family protein [Flavobacteriales bacterium]
MIQRVQSLFLFFAAKSSLVILFYAPVFINESNTEEFLLLKDVQFPTLVLSLSILLSIYSIFLYKNRLLQLKIVSFAKLAVSLSFLLLVLLPVKEGFVMYYGQFFLLVPFLVLFLSTYFIKKDEKLVRSADRIR